MTVTDSEGRVANYPGRIVVVPEAHDLDRLLLPARVGSFFQRKLATVGGVKPAVWRLARGPLPRGVRFDRFAGVLYGYPDAAGSLRVTFEATDSFGVMARKTLRIIVLPAPQKPVTG